MRNSYNWKAHYAASFKEVLRADSFCQYHLENETGQGWVVACSVLPGVQAICNDLHLARCARPVEPDENVIEINYCIEGRYECTLNRQYCFFVESGDFSVGMVGRRESRGGFPLNRFRGISVFLEMDLFAEKYSTVIRELEIDLEKIRCLASRKPRYYVLHHQEGLETILQGLTEGFERKNKALLKLKTMELLLYLSRSDLKEAGDLPAYLNKKQVMLAESVQKILAEDLTRHVTIEQMAKMLKVSETGMKSSFKSVYGCSIYQYQKSIRLEEAQRLLRETTLSITEIALQVGYLNPAKFSTAFKNRFGLKPKEYRNSW